MPEADSTLPIDLGGYVEEQFVPTPVPPGLMDWAQKRSKELHQVFQNMRSASLGDHFRLLKCYKDFINYVDEQNIPYDYKFLIPMVYNHIRITFARLLDSARAQENLCKVRPFGGLYMPERGLNYVEAETRALLGEAATNASLNMGGIHLDLCAPYLDAAIFGRVITRSGWAAKYRWDEAMGRTLSKEYNKTTRVTPYNFYMDPYATDEQKARWTAELLEWTEEDVRELMAARVILPDCLSRGLIKPQSGGGAGMYNVTQQLARELRHRGDMVGADAGYYHGVEMWSFEDPYGRGLPSLFCWFLDADTGNLLGCHENPYKHGERPYEVGWPMPVPDQPYGIGLSEMLHPLMHLQSSTLMHIYENFAGQNIRHLVVPGYVDEAALAMSRANGIIHATNTEAWKPVQSQAMHPESWNFLSYFDGKGQETSGVTDVVSAVRAASTAYASDMLKGQAQINFNVFIDCLKLSWLDKVMRHHFSNAQQFLDQDIFGTVDLGNGQKARVPISGPDFEGEFIVDAYDLRSAAMRAQQAQQIGTITAQAMQAQLPLNYFWLLEQMYKLLGLPEPHMAFAAAHQVQPGPTQVPDGVQDQQAAASAETPNQLMDRGGGGPEGPDPRVAMRPGMMGEAPASLEGLLGGGG